MPSNFAATGTVTTGTFHGDGNDGMRRMVPVAADSRRYPVIQSAVTHMRWEGRRVIFPGMRGIASAAAMHANIPRMAPQVQAWTSSTLDSVVWSDILGGNVLPISRPDAMAVPAAARARHLTCGAIARLPLATYRLETVVNPMPYWCQGSDGQLGDLSGADQERTGIEAQSTFQRTLNTVDDHIFYGESLWAITRKDADGRPSRMVHVPWNGWDRVFTEDTHTWVFTDYGGAPLDFPVVYIPGPHEGILNFAQRTIRAASALEVTAADVASRPFRIELHQTTDIELTKDERAQLIQATRAALADNNGVLFTNAAVETKTHSLDPASDLLIAGRNSSAVDIARVVSIPSAMIDAVTEGASLTYETTQGRNQEWIDFGLQLYVDAITSRLSMDDVVPAGQRTAFDLSALTTPAAPATGNATED